MPNRRKTSITLAVAQVQNLNAAYDHARCTRTPFQITCTLHAALVGGPGNGSWQSNRFPLLWRYLKRQFRRWGLIWTALYVHESSKNGKDLHTHMFLHAPDKTWVQRIDHYIRKQVCVLPASSAVKTTWVYDNGGHPNKWLSYIMKHRPGGNAPPAPITGKRCGVSRNIDRAARALQDRISRRVKVRLPREP